MKKFDDLDLWFTNIKLPKPKARAKITGSTATAKPVSSNTIKRGKSGVKRLMDIASKKPETVVKLRSNTKSLYQLKTHFKYVSRDGELVIENQDGDLFTTKEDIGYLCQEWQAFGYPQVRSKLRESFHFILSMPPGTEPRGEMEAARAMCKEVFAGHKYTLVQHLDEDHPHVHVCVMALNDKGKRLNPRKSDLQHYREVFADRLQDNGIEATASRRYQRFKYKRPENNKLRHMRKRGGKSKVYQEQAEVLKEHIKNNERPINPAEKSIHKVQFAAANLYMQVAQELEKQGDKEAAKTVENFVQQGISSDKRSLQQVQYDYLQKQLEKSKEQTKER